MRYSLVTINITLIGATGSHKVSVLASHSGILVELTALVKKHMPKAKTRNDKTSPGLDSPNLCEFHNLSEEDLEVAWAMIKYLCDTNWEPFSTDSYMTSMAAGIQRYHFRQVF